MKKKYFDNVISKHSYIAICMFFILLNKASAQKVLDNDILRFGTGTENSVNSGGNLQQPFYYNPTTLLWAKLTYSNYPFDNAYYIGGDGSNEWNTNGSSSINATLTDQTVDDSQFITTTSPKGYGTIVSKGNITINGSLLEVENTYTLEEKSSFIIINVKIKNIGTAPVTNVRFWSGTKDDFIGSNDFPFKTRGNIVGEAFVPLDASTDRAKALKLYSGEEGVIIFSNSNRANTIIQSCCQWSNVINQNPNTSVINSGSTDGSYGFFVRLNDLAVGESDEFKWYYAAGKVVVLEEIIKDIANASGVVTDIKYTSANFNTLSQTNVTGYYVVVPTGSQAPTIAEIKSGVNYGGVNVVASGSSALVANIPKSYPITGLTINTAYDFYFVTEDGGSSYSTIFNSPFATPDLLKLTVASESNVSCNGKNDGTASVTTTGGTPTYSYSWSSSGGNSATAINLSPGNYVVTVTDINNETATQDFTITEPDELIATIGAQINADCSTHANGEATIAVTGGTGIYTYSWNTTPVQTTATATGLLPGGYIVTVTDEKLCSTTESVTIIVDDKIDPTVITKNITVGLDTTGNATITADDIDNGSSDNCGIDTKTLDKITFDCTNVGANTVTLTITDVNGNSVSKAATVTIEDKIDPNVITQNITAQLDATGNATITADDIDNGSSDNCRIDTKSLDKTTFDCTNVGANTVTLTITDVNGNSVSKTATVTIEDKIDPTVVIQNITVGLDATGNATITADDIDNGSSDNCRIDTKTLDKTTFDCTNVGANTVTLTITDVNGNSVSKTATVTIEDKIAPNALTKNITVPLDVTGNVTINATQIDNGSNDNCGIVTMELDKSSFDCSNIGVNTVTLTVKDKNGNSASKTATVTIEDKIVPNVMTKNIIAQLDATGNAIITATQINNGSNDACGIDTIVLDKTTFDCTNIGPNTITVTATDFNRNSASGTAVVTIEDKIAPNVITKNILLQLDALGNATIMATDIDNGSSDACGIDTMLLDKTTFDCTNIGANTVTLTVKDKNGNSASRTAIVTIEDKVNPNVITKNIIVGLDALGNATITAANLDNGSSDACGIDTMLLDKNTFDCTNVGVNTVTLTVKDKNGNSASKNATVTIEDKIAPNVITKNITVGLDATGNVTITAADIDNGSSDACGIDTMLLDKTTFDCTNIGANTVTLTVKDKDGNTASRTATVTIEDKVNPNVITKNITVELDALGNATITATDIDNGSSDACGIDTMLLDKTTFDCTNVGVNTVTLTVKDKNGNSASRTATVTIEDKITPNVITKNITVPLDASGNATIATGDIDNGSSDACGIDTILLDKTTFDCTNIGVNTVTLTVKDKNGNSASKTATVTIEDKIVPNAMTKNIIAQLDATGNAIITAAQINNGSNDVCGIDTMTLDKTTFNCSNIGVNNVTLTVTDKNGNSATGMAVVTVKDLIAPNVVTQNITVQLDATGNAAIIPALIDNGSNDACGIDMLVLDKTAFTCSDLGTNTVTLTVTDFNRNSASGTAVVTVEDKIIPNVITQDITVQLNTAGIITITANQINNGSTDNCAINGMLLDKTTFDCTNIGVNTVTLTVIDKSGNRGLATATVTVLPIPEPTFLSLTQEFCLIDAPAIRDIEVHDKTYVKWFIDATSTQSLSLNTNITSGTYYAATNYGNCNSNRIPVTIIVKDALAPTGNNLQYICKEKEATITELITNEQEVLWYETATGGVPLPSTTILEDKNKYYASYIGAECESSKRLEVEVIIRYCDVVVYNGISANGDGKNDSFFVEGATTFPDNKLEIFNSWGSLVYESSRYGQDDNLFKGFGNKGLGNGNGLLPFGTYYYVFSFTNHDNKRITKTGFLHLNP